MTRCCVCKGKNDLHPFPEGKTRQDVIEQWIKFARIEKVVHLKKRWYLCKNHFANDAFQNDSRKKLLRIAIPTLNPPIDEFEDSTLERRFVETAVKGGRKMKETESSDTINKELNISRLNLCHGNDDSLMIGVQPGHIDELSEQKDLLSPNLSSVDYFNLSFNSEKDLNGNLKYNANNSSHLSDPFKNTKASILLQILNNRSKIDMSSNNLEFAKITEPVSVTPPKSSSIMDLLSDGNKNVKKGASSILVNVKSRAVKKRNSSLPANLKVCMKPFVVSDLRSPSLPKEGWIVPGPTPHIMMSKSNFMDKGDEENAFSPNSFIEDHCAGEEIVREINHSHGQNTSLKSLTNPSVRKKKYYDPALIESVLNKMKLKKSGPIRVVALQKKLDKVSRNFTTSKVVTLYKQRIKKKKLSKKSGTGNKPEINKKGVDKQKKIQKKRKCTCSMHCLRSKHLPPVVQVSSGIGVRFVGDNIYLNGKNVSSDDVGEELLNKENVFNVSTILTSVHDKSQIEQLCQILIETIFSLKNLNIEGTMAKLEVYISQIPSNKESSDKETPVIKPGCESKRSIQVEEPILDEESGIFRSFEFTDSDIIDTDLTASSGYGEPAKGGSDSLDFAIASSGLSNITTDSINNLSQKLTTNNVKVRLSSLHDHNYIKHESNYLFEKPEYLVKLINIETYKHPKKKIRSLQPRASTKDVEMQRKICQKLSNKIIRLKDLIQKKNKSMKSMKRKIKYLGSVVCEEKGLKRIKYPKGKENVEDKIVLNDSFKDFFMPVQQDGANKQKKQRNSSVILDEFKIGDTGVSEHLNEMSFFNEVAQFKINKESKKNSRKNIDIESFDVLYEKLIEEVCYTDMEINM